MDGGKGGGHRIADIENQQSTAEKELTFFTSSLLFFFFSTMIGPFTSPKRDQGGGRQGLTPCPPSGLDHRSVWENLDRRAVRPEGYVLVTIQGLEGCDLIVKV